MLSLNPEEDQQQDHQQESHSSFDEQKQESLSKAIDFNQLKEIKEIGQMPMRYTEGGYIYRKKGEPHMQKKGEISIYYICMKCPKILIFDWGKKQFKSQVRRKLTIVFINVN